MSAGIWAQEEAMFENRTFYGGLLLGANLAQVDGDNFAGYHRPGFNAGGVVYIKLKTQMALSMEVLLSQKGSRATTPQMLPSGLYITKYGIDLNYAEVPVLINFFDKHSSHLCAGFSYSALGSSGEYITTHPAVLYDLGKYPFKKDDINILLGGNLHLYKCLFFNLRFQYSVIPIRDKVPVDYIRGAQYNNVWVVRLMYLF